MSVYGYIRMSKSRRKPGDPVLAETQKYSPDSQLEIIHQECDRLGIPYPEDHRLYVDGATSGASRLCDRPYGGRLLRELCKRRGNILVVAYIDRLGRKVYDIMGVISTLLDAGVSLRVGTGILQGKDLESTEGVVLMAGMMVAAQIERELTSSRTKIGLRTARQCGVALGRPAYGERERGKVKKDGYRRFEEDPQEAAILAKMIELSGDHSYWQIAEILNECGLTRRGSKPWTKQEVYRKLRRYRERTAKRLL